MEVHDRKFTAKLFDQRNTLPIYINHMPYLDRNIPSKIFYASVGSEILNIVRITTDLVNMVTHVNLLLIWMKKKGNECTRIISLLNKIFVKYFKIYHKLSFKSNEFIKLFSLELFVDMCMYMHIFMCICKYLLCNLCV